MRRSRTRTEVQNQVKPSGPAKPRRLRDAINAYRDTHSLDEAALGLLGRLKDSDDAARAFMKLQLSERDETPILQTFIQADQLARTFLQQIEKAERTLEQAGRLDKSVTALRRFVDELIAELQAPPAFDLLSARILEPPANIEAMKRGLALIADRIGAGRRVAKEDLLRLWSHPEEGQPQKGRPQER